MSSLDFERKHAEDLQRLSALRLLDDDFMNKVFEDKPCAEFLLQNNATAQKQRRDKAVVETGCVVQRCGHEHDVVLRKMQAAAERSFGENERIMGDQNRLRATSGAGSGKDQHHIV